ncbi:hypothetical protein GI374_14730 [Paracoccus sp. S-4012]|uniref:hypothetical protein n=1 Tax=Paracoccus sp. S-4012 TaxID=2665648 RepID=UPI0012AF1A91|nr:hypothetical protein [Paracoccus sp. S-4012]MRX51667.1 hypothetical protein [Paracoccus sp. S-4012]
MTEYWPKTYLALAMASGVFCAGPVHAEPAAFCGSGGARDWAQVRQALVGDWQVIHQSGFARAGGMTMPFSADDKVEIMTLSVNEDRLIGNHPGMQNPLIFHHAEEGRWNVDRGDPYKPDPVMTPDEVGVMYGCDQMEMPRLIGTSSAVIEGMKMNFTYRVLAVDRTTLYGVMEVTGTARGHEFLARRTVWLRAAGN